MDVSFICVASTFIDEPLRFIVGANARETV